MANSSRSRATRRDFSGFYRFDVGDFELAVINDGSLEIQPPAWGINVEPSEVFGLLQRHNIDLQVVDSPFNCLLVDTGEARVLVDTGGGEFAMPDSVPNGGKLIPTMEQMGIAATSINHVIITHFHPDHVGNVSHEGKVAFPNATYHISQTEYEFIQSADENPFVPFARSKLAPVEAENQLVTFADNAEIIAGIRTMPAPGHTPGHIVLLIGEGDAQLFHMVDCAPNPYVSLQRPEWHFGFDSDPEQGVTTRKAMLGKAADEQLLVMSYHFPFPALGYVYRDGDAFRYAVTS